MKRFTVYLQGDITLLADTKEEAAESVKRKLEVVPKMFGIEPMIVKEQYDIIGMYIIKKKALIDRYYFSLRWSAAKR